MTTGLGRFSAVLALVTTGGSSLMAFRRYAQAARDMIMADPSASAAWLLLAISADRFALNHLEEPISVDDAKLAYDDLETLSAIFDKRLAAPDSGEQLGALNQAARLVIGGAPANG